MSKVVENEKAILDHVNKHGFVRTECLAKYFKMTPQSVRRYTKSLSDKGLVSRSHGGVAKIEFNGVSSESNRIVEYAGSLKIESLSLICFEPFNANIEFTSKLTRFLNENSRIDPQVHIIIETANAGWAASEADKMLRKLTRSQVAIFCKSVTNAVINVALIARKREFETFLICQDKVEDLTADIDLLSEQEIGLLTYEMFQAEWKYARI